MSQTKPRSRCLEDELLRRFHRDGDYAARTEFVERTMPIVHHVARRYAQRGQHYDELVQAGSIGLLKAVDRFDPDRGVKFVTFAIPTITGEIRRFFRDHGWGMRVPREVQERDALLSKVEERLVRKLQRIPSVRELADAADLTSEQVLDTLAAARNYTVVSLDAPIGEDRSGLDLVGGRDPGYDQVDHHLQLVDGMKILRERERRIIGLRFGRGLTQAEIAAQLGISQMHVSRLLSAALAELAANLRDEDAHDQPSLREGRA